MDFSEQYRIKGEVQDLERYNEKSINAKKSKNTTCLQLTILFIVDDKTVNRQKVQ